MTIDALQAWLLSYETAFRLGVFAGVLVLMCLLEATWPRRVRTRPRTGRWIANLGVVVIASALARVTVPMVPVAAALWAAEAGWGVFNATGLPGVVAGLACIVVLDLAIWGQHVIFHKVPVLWRLHRMHHTDVDLDATSGVRFHPVEIVLSLFIKTGLVIALGAPAWSVVAFEVLLNASSMFNHANLRLPAAVDRALRTVIVTPDFHRVHHSVIRTETDSNYGFNLSVWDRTFGTYRAQPEAGHDGMTVGLADFRSPREQRLDRLILQPVLATSDPSRPSQ